MSINPYAGSHPREPPAAGQLPVTSATAYSYDRKETVTDYICAARSNRFHAKDEQPFMAWVNQMPGVRAEKEPDNRFVLVCEADSGGWPTGLFDPETGEEREVDFPQELAEHLHQGEVAVLEEAGYEGLRAIVGEAIAVSHRGEILAVSISEIYERVRAAGWAERVNRAID